MDNNFDINSYLQEIEDITSESFENDIEDFMNILTMPFNQLPQLSEETPPIDHALNEGFIFWEDFNENENIDRLGEVPFRTEVLESFELNMNVSA